MSDQLPDGEDGFVARIEAHRAELRRHCYRMTGSYDESEDLVQEVLLRAWRARGSYEGRSSLRTWLYRVATNTCLDHLRRVTRRPAVYEPIPGMDHGSDDPPPRIAWLQPYPDETFAHVPAPDDGPAVAAEHRETMELLFLAAIQHLPPRQRAALILRDVLEIPAADAADMLDMSVASLNSALQRARPTIRGHLPRHRAEWAPATGPTAEEREVLRQYMECAAAMDVKAMAGLLSEDIRLTMPPNPYWFTGRDTLLRFLAPTLDPDSPTYFGEWRHLPTAANGMPAAGGYVRRPGTSVYRAQVLDVLRVEGGRIAEITSFEPHLFPVFGLPLVLPGSGR
ncbi:RNA polymerase subunit sigma-70 [Streptomyces sp. NPDC051940]|uniref:RNA polymerase subunit sigma-70 n=1 Tax=Streptomyces sp. NPDC051940 TaxID=3155675 RepID=UPI003419400D